MAGDSFDISKVTNLAKVKALMEARNSGKRKVVKESDLLAALANRVRGQDEALAVIARAVSVGYAKEKRTQPVATVLLVGPPGTGKTQTAKTLCGFLFGAESDLLTINGGEYQHPEEGVFKLIGTGPMYKGSDQGGALTRPMFGKRERVVLFDEIEKMNARCYDVFLNLLQDGYVTEAANNKRADFTSAVIVLTSNLDHEKCAEIFQGFPDHEARTAAYKEHFNARQFMRPEILDRIPDIIYFKPLQPEIMMEIAGLAINDLVLSFGAKLKWIAPEVIAELVATVSSSSGGVRMMQQIVERRVGSDVAALKQRGIIDLAIVHRDGRLAAVDLADAPEAGS